MRITKVEFVGLRSPLQSPAQFSWGAAQERNVGLVKAVLEDGTVGWGETSVTFPLWSLEERAHTVNIGLAPLAVGLSFDGPQGIRDIAGKARSAMGRLESLWSPVAISAAVGALEMALLDAWGKAQNAPVWELLGGSSVDVPLYAVGFTGTPEEAAAQAAASLSEGFAAVKIRVGFGPEQDLRVATAFRKALGDEAVIYADANMGWDLDTALEMAERLAGTRLGWLEEPLDRTDVDGLGKLRAAGASPLAAGENCYSEQELTALADSGMVDVLMPDLARCGGFSAGLAGARRAVERGIEYSTHHYASDIGFSAMLALCAVAGPSAPILRDITPWPLREEILQELVAIVGGTARPYEGPGLAPSPSETEMQKWRIL